MPSPSEKVIKPETFRNTVLWTNETKIELFNHGHNHTKFRGGCEAFEEKTAVE